MNIKLYCHQCKQIHDVTIEDANFMMLCDPEHMLKTPNLYSYSGSCFFKTLAAFKGTENSEYLRKGA